MHAHSDVAEVLDRLGELATVRRPDDALLAPFLSLYYSELPGEDVDDRKIDDIYAVGVAHFDLGRKRPAGSAVIRVMSPDRERDGWSTPHSVVLVVTDDMPFLVDTMRMLLERHGLDIRLLVHPILLVERDGSDVMQRVALFSDRLEGRADESLLVEAWTQIEIDRIDDELTATLETELAAAIADVRRVVTDFDPMRERLAPRRTSTPRCSGSPTGSSCSSAPSTRRATTPATSRRSPAPASASSPTPTPMPSPPSRLRRPMRSR